MVLEKESRRTERVSSDQGQGIRFTFISWLLATAVLFGMNVLAPWASADRALAYLGGKKIMVSAGLEGSFSEPSQRSRRQAYLVFPASLKSLAAYEVIEENGLVHVETVPYGLFFVSLIYLTWGLCPLWYWLYLARHPPGR